MLSFLVSYTFSKSLKSLKSFKSLKSLKMRDEDEDRIEDRWALRIEYEDEDVS